MPSPEPNQKMEELLRAYARKRRDEAGAPFELPPDVRARLQEEVRGTLRKSAAAPAPRWGLSLAGWLRLALAGSVAVLVILMIRSNTAPPASSRQQFAKAEEKKAAPVAPTTTLTARKPAPATPAPSADAFKAPVAAAAPVVPPPTVAPPASNRALAMEKSSSPNEDAAKAAFAKSMEMPNTATASNVFADGTAGSVSGGIAGAPAGGGGGAGFGGGGGFGGFGRGGRNGGGGGGRGGASASAAPAAQIASVSPAAAGNVNAVEQAASSTATRNSQSTLAFAQQMARSGPAARRAPVESDRITEAPSSSVLATFKIERNGNQVRIVDADGSAYEGRVVAPEMLDQLQAGLADRRAAKDLGVPPGAAAKAAPQNAPQGSNFARSPGARNNAPINTPAKGGELLAGTANFDSAARNQAGASQSNLTVTQPAGDGSGFAFQVSGLNRKLNQTVNIIGSCAPMLLPQGASQIGGNSSNQSQALAGANAGASPARPPAGLSQAGAGGNNMVNYQNNAAAAPASPFAQNAQNALNLQNSLNLQNAPNMVLSDRFWRVTGQVQIGASNRFNLDAATVPP
jgi:hypothetical protein